MFVSHTWTMNSTMNTNIYLVIRENGTTQIKCHRRQRLLVEATQSVDLKPTQSSLCYVLHAQQHAAMLYYLYAFRATQKYMSHANCCGKLHAAPIVALRSDRNVEIYRLQYSAHAYTQAQRPF